MAPILQLPEGIWSWNAKSGGQCPKCGQRTFSEAFSWVLSTPSWASRSPSSLISLHCLFTLLPWATLSLFSWAGEWPSAIVVLLSCSSDSRRNVPTSEHITPSLLWATPGSGPPTASHAGLSLQQKTSEQLFA